MDVDFQVFKHLARDAQLTTRVIDEYCGEYKDLFKEVRSYECFKYLHYDQRVRANKWCKFKRVFSDGKSENRYIREIIYGKKRGVTYWETTTDPETMPPNSTSFVQTNLKGKPKKIVGNLYGLRTWVEYGFRQCKQELGWTDYRFTNFKDIEKWWSIIFCVYTMISLNSPAFLSLNLCDGNQSNPNNNSVNLSAHQQWDHKTGWKNTLNNFRLFIQLMVLFWLIHPWLEIFPNSNLLLRFKHLIDAMNQFQPLYSSA